MNKIQVNTIDLLNGSNNLKSASGEIGNVQNQVSSTSNSVGNVYDGQLRQAIEGIASGSAQTGARLRNRAVELENELISRAVKFEAANETGRSAVLGASTAYIDFIETTSALRFLSILNKWKEKMLSIFAIGGLTISGYFFVKKPIVIQSIPTPGPPKNYEGIGQKVSEDDKELNKKLSIYKRGPSSSISSNCTWYAAAAVFAAHGILLISYDQGNNKGWFKFGDGGEWAENAEKAKNDPTNKYNVYIEDVNYTPSPGSVYSGPSGGSEGHVYFVEDAYQVTEENGAKVWRVVISEENYYDGESIIDKNNYSKPSEVKIENHPEVKRWTRTIDYPIDKNGNALTAHDKSGNPVLGGKFIHFKK